MGDAYQFILFLLAKLHIGSFVCMGFLISYLLFLFIVKWERCKDELLFLAEIFYL